MASKEEIEELLKSIPGVEDVDDDTRREIDQALLELADQAAEFWQSIAPVGDANDPNSGRYRDSIRVEVDGSKVYVLTDDPIANLIEYGSVHNDEFACRARTEDQFQGQARDEHGRFASKKGQVQIVGPNKSTAQTRARIEQSRQVARRLNK